MKRFFFVFFIVGLCVGALFLSLSWAVIEEASPEPEAREWLKASASADFFDATSRCFLTRYEAKRLVSKLYDAGALMISVIFLNREPEGFRVTLPLDKDRRIAIFQIVNRTLQRQGFSFYRDADQDDVVIWIAKDSYE